MAFSAGGTLPRVDATNEITLGTSAEGGLFDRIAHCLHA